MIPAIDMKTAVREQVNALSADEYFTLLAKLMVDNPPADADKPMIEKMAKLGIVPGQPFDSSKLGPVAKEALSLVPKIANEKIMLWLKEGILAGDMKLENGWVFTTKTGLYGVNYIQRALDNGHRSWGEPSAGCRLSHLGGAFHPELIHRREEVRHAFQQRRTSAREWFLVAYDVRQGLLLR